MDNTQLMMIGASVVLGWGALGVGIPAIRTWWARRKVSARNRGEREWERFVELLPEGIRESVLGWREEKDARREARRWRMRNAVLLSFGAIAVVEFVMLISLSYQEWVEWRSPSVMDSVPEAQLQIGWLQNTRARAGCGCRVFPVRSRERNMFKHTLFVADVSCKARMNINGRDVEFRARRRPSGGDVAELSCMKYPRFFGEGMTVRTYYRKTKGCPPNAPDCEVKQYDAAITVSADGFRRTVRGVAYCGC